MQIDAGISEVNVVTFADWVGRTGSSRNEGASPGRRRRRKSSEPF